MRLEFWFPGVHSPISVFFQGRLQSDAFVNCITVHTVVTVVTDGFMQDQLFTFLVHIMDVNCYAN